MTTFRRHPAATFAQPGSMDEKLLLRITKGGGMIGLLKGEKERRGPWLFRSFCTVQLLNKVFPLRESPDPWNDGVIFICFFMMAE